MKLHYFFKLIIFFLIAGFLNFCKEVGSNKQTDKYPNPPPHPKIPVDKSKKAQLQEIQRQKLFLDQLAPSIKDRIKEDIEGLIARLQVLIYPEENETNSSPPKEDTFNKLQKKVQINMEKYKNLVLENVLENQSLTLKDIYPEKRKPFKDLFTQIDSTKDKIKNFIQENKIDNRNLGSQYQLVKEAWNHPYFLVNDLKEKFNTGKQAPAFPNRYILQNMYNDIENSLTKDGRSLYIDETRQIPLNITSNKQSLIIDGVHYEDLKGQLSPLLKYEGKYIWMAGIDDFSNIDFNKHDNKLKRIGSNLDNLNELIKGDGGINDSTYNFYSMGAPYLYDSTTHSYIYDKMVIDDPDKMVIVEDYGYRFLSEVKELKTKSPELGNTGKFAEVGTPYFEVYDYTFYRDGRQSLFRYVFIIIEK